jgi:arsenate reductase
MRPAILVLCTGNSARSQMGEGLFRHYLGDRFDIHSAGTKPSFVRPEAIAVMAELGIDISKQWSKSVNEFLERDFACIVTVCDNAKESCPHFPGQAQRIHWSFEDPAAVEGDEAVRLDAFRRIRDQIQARIVDFARGR